MINPYEFLGVTIDTPRDDIKRKYYELALLVHPDKGGNKEDMMYLHQAYRFIMREINNIKNVTVEDLQSEFDEFCNTQKESIPLFQDIYAEAFDLPKFNHYFQEFQGDLIKPYLDGGYGDYMDTVDNNIDNNMNMVVTEYSPIEKNVVTHPFTDSIILYKSPQEMQCCEEVYDLEQKDVDDFTIKMNNLSLADYKQAFTNNCGESNFINKSMNRTYESLLEERNTEVNESLIGNMSQYTWSYMGFIDPNGKRINDYMQIK